jgi:hypothetical protein
MSINTDLKGLVALQKNYLDILDNKQGDPEFTNKIDDLQTQLENAHKSFKDANVSSDNVLTRQEEVTDIVTTEKDRLMLKKQSIDNALVGKKREIELNDSYQKKQAEYNKIKLAWVIALAISVLSIILKKQLSFVPSFIFDLVTIIVLFGASIYTISVLVEVSRREKINFNKLDLPEPVARTADELRAAAAAAAKEEGGDLLSGMNLYGCVGSYCCSPGTKWDNDVSKCVHDEEYDPNEIQDDEQTEEFNTMINTQHINKRRININTVKDNYANEYDNYSKV